MSTCPYTPKPEFARFLASSERSISLSGYELYKIEPCGWPESISHLQVIRGCRAMARKFDTVLFAGKLEFVCVYDPDKDEVVQVGNVWFYDELFDLEGGRWSMSDADREIACCFKKRVNETLIDMMRSMDVDEARDILADEASEMRRLLPVDLQHRIAQTYVSAGSMVYPKGTVDDFDCNLATLLAKYDFEGGAKLCAEFYFSEQVRSFAYHRLRMYEWDTCAAEHDVQIRTACGQWRAMHETLAHMDCKTVKVVFERDGGEFDVPVDRERLLYAIQTDADRFSPNTNFDITYNHDVLETDRFKGVMFRKKYVFQYDSADSDAD